MKKNIKRIFFLALFTVIISNSLLAMEHNETDEINDDWDKLTFNATPEEILEMEILFNRIARMDPAHKDQIFDSFCRENDRAVGRDCARKLIGVQAYDPESLERHRQIMETLFDQQQAENSEK